MCGVVKKFEEYKVVMVIVAVLSATVDLPQVTSTSGCSAHEGVPCSTCTRISMTRYSPSWSPMHTSQVSRDALPGILPVITSPTVWHLLPWSSSADLGGWCVGVGYRFCFSGNASVGYCVCMTPSILSTADHAYQSLLFTADVPTCT